jgi:hypothetical protein
MKRWCVAFLVGVAVALMSGNGMAQWRGTLGVFADIGGTSCTLDDTEPGLIQAYVIHKWTLELTASQFRVAADEGFTGVYLSHEAGPGFLGIGLPPEDYAVSYGACATGDFLVVTITYQAFGTSAVCSNIGLAAAPTSPLPGQIAVADCGFQYIAAHLYPPLVVNAQGNLCVWCIDPVESSTWGRIKALYR